jgi:hypothetical protein
MPTPEEDMTMLAYVTAAAAVALVIKSPIGKWIAGCLPSNNSFGSMS